MRGDCCILSACTGYLCPARELCLALRVVGVGGGVGVQGHHKGGVDGAAQRCPLRHVRQALHCVDIVINDLMRSNKSQHTLGVRALLSHADINPSALLRLLAWLGSYF